MIATVRFTESQTLMKVYPKLGAIVGISAPAVPGIAEATKQAGRPDVKVTGLSLPNLCKPYVHSGYISTSRVVEHERSRIPDGVTGEALATVD